MEDLNAAFVALQAGETLIDGSGNELKEVSGVLIFSEKSCDIWPINWEIKKPKEWHDNLKGREVLCKVWDYNMHKSRVSPIISFNKNSECPFEGEIKHWINAIPLSSKEIEVYLKRAKDIENDVF